MMNKTFLLVLSIALAFSNNVSSQINVKKAKALVKSTTEKQSETTKDIPSSTSKTYQTGTSAGDNKLKAFNQKMTTLEEALATFDAFLKSDGAYDPKQNSFAFIGEGNSLRLTHKYIENNYESPLMELKNGKKYAPDYGFVDEENRYTNLMATYTRLKEGSYERAIEHKTSIKSHEYLTSHDYATSQYVNSERFKEKPEDPIVSEMHKNNKGKIVFHTSEIDRSNPTGKFDGTFSATDRLYARAFFKRGFTNLTMTSPKGDSTRYAANGVVFPYTLVYIDGKLQDFKYDNASLIESEVLKNNTRQIWLHPLVADGLTDIHWVKTVDKLSAGNHAVTLEYYIEEPINTNERYTAKIAEGTFNLVKKQGDKIKLGKSWSSFKVAMNNPSYESKILYVAQQTSKMEDGLTAKSVKIVSSDWSIVKNNLTGAILYRYLVVQVKFTNADGYCYTAPREAKQEYAGNGNYASEFTLITHLNKKIGFNGYIDCD